MAGINQGRPELAVGEPIRLGNNDEFEIEQHPVSDRLIIRDTVNGKVAYVRKERGGQIGGDGVLIKALKEGKPMADDGRTYDTIQQAERAANGWVFVPPGTFEENISVTTEGLTIRGSGRNTVVDGLEKGPPAIEIDTTDVTVKDIAVRTTTGAGGVPLGCDPDKASNVTLNRVHSLESGSRGLRVHGDNALIVNCRVENPDNHGIIARSNNQIIVNNYITSGEFQAIFSNGNGGVIANNIVNNPDSSINARTDDQIIIGNRVINSAVDGIAVDSGVSNTIIANNRVSGSNKSDIDDQGTGTLLDANLTGASN
jgi:parallel beta-helix repeat protein